jgi:hypothetical protein
MGTGPKARNPEIQQCALDVGGHDHRRGMEVVDLAPAPSPLRDAGKIDDRWCRTVRGLSRVERAVEEDQQLLRLPFHGLMLNAHAESPSLGREVRRGRRRGGMVLQGAYVFADVLRSLVLEFRDLGLKLSRRFLRRDDPRVCEKSFEIVFR